MSGVVIFSSAALCSSSDWNKSGEELNFKKDNEKVISTKSKMCGLVIFSAPPLIGKAGQVRVRFTKSRRTTKVIRTKLGPFR